MPLIQYLVSTVKYGKNKRADFLQLSSDVRIGANIPSSDLPKTMWSDSKRIDNKKLKHMANASGPYIVSSEFNNISQKYNPGCTNLYPVELLKSNRKDRYQGDYFFLNACEHKDAFEPSQSPNYSPTAALLKGQKGAMPIILRDESIAVDSDALCGCDIWIDETLQSSMFFSGNLARKFMSSKMIHSTGAESKSITRCIWL